MNRRPISYIIKSSEDFHLWLFAQSARIIEFLNTCLLILFTLPFIYNLEGILATPLYERFSLLEQPQWWFGMLSVGFLQMYVMLKRSIHSNQFSGFVLLVSAWVWAMIGSLFIQSGQLINTAPIVYITISFVCAMSGYYLIKHNKDIEDRFTKRV